MSTPKKEETEKLTSHQLNAIGHENGDILVSASAGSGKTFVMISRIVRLVLEGKTTVDKILATTFTEAAASEMKDKLKKALAKKVAETGDENLAKQIPLVGNADVCTIHSFCAKLIRTYFYTVGLAPDFKIITEEEQTVYVNRALKSTFNYFYAKKDEKFLRLVDRTCKRSDADLRKEVLSAYAFCSEEVDFDGLLEKSIQNTQKENFENIIDKCQATLLAYLEKQIIKMKMLSVEVEKQGFKKLYNKLISCIAFYEVFSKNGSIFCPAFEKKDYTLGNSGEKCDLRVEVAQLLKETCNALVQGVYNYSSKEECLNECGVIGENTESFVELVKTFNTKYKAEKLEDNYLDFSDLQRYALKILSDESVRKEISDKYDYIFVDEYQDVNALQEKLISMIGKDNVFTVGDDKQSIYAFRGSRSEFFVEKQKKMKEDGKTTEKLNDNFRSAINVVNAVNDVFDSCMTEENYGISYKDKARLIYGKRFPEGYDGRFEIHAITSNKTAGKVEEEKSAEIYDVLKNLTPEEDADERATVEEVIKIIETETGKNGTAKTYYDLKDKKEKKVEYKDIVILISKSSVEVSALVKALIKRGIPITYQEEEQLLDYPEIKTIINILSAINCMAQDIPLANVLKSTYGGFTDEDLLAIVRQAEKGREKNKSKSVEKGDEDKSFYSAYKYCLDGGEENLKARLTAFNEKFNKLRELADFCSVAEVVEKIIDDCEYIESQAVTPYGEEKAGRIKEFSEYVSSVGGDISVREFLKRFTLTGGKVEKSATARDNAVRIMTMHKSKGLEFPVVINFGLSSSFSTQELERIFLHDRQYGLVSSAYDDTNRTVKNGFLRTIVLNKIKADAVKEQMRLFYVAMTRATYSLHLVFAKAKKQSEEIKSLAGFIPIEMIEEVDCERAGLEKIESATNEIETTIGVPDDSLVKGYEKAFKFDYGYTYETTMPLKSSVSAANREIESKEETVHYAFNEEEGQSTEDGVTAHKILEHFDFESGENVFSQVEKLIAKGVVEREKVEKLKLENIDRAINSGAFDIVKGKKLYREKSFLSFVPAKMLFGGESKSGVLCQGVIDLLVIDETGATVIDYKYSAKSEKALKESYAKQLNLYAYAVETALDIKVTGKKIVSLLTGKVTEIE